MPRAVAFPPGSWPHEMRAETAAAFCDEPSVEAFRRKVERGVYSKPRTASGCLPKWHRSRLEQDIDRRHGLSIAPLPLAESVEDLI